MNRASLALVLLLGTVAATLVAAGVARDLDRAGPRPSEPGVVQIDEISHAIPPRAPWGVFDVVPCGLSLDRAAPPSVADLSPLVPRGLPVEWKPWSKHLVAVPPMDLVSLKPVVKSCRIVDRRQLARLLSRYKPGDTKQIDALIRSNDGITEADEPATIPYGHVSVGNRLLKLEHCASGGGPSFAWTGALHYGADRRRTLMPIDPAAALCRQVEAPLPGEPLRLWSDDCRAMIAATSDGAQGAVEGLMRGLSRVAKVVNAADWVHGRFDDALASVADHVKREVWLATLPHSPKAAPVQSAQRPRAETAKE